MSSHVELNPDDDMLGLCLGLKAMRLALTQKTHKTGTIRIPTSTGKDFIADRYGGRVGHFIDDVLAAGGGHSGHSERGR